MMVESWSNLVNVILAVAVIYFGWAKMGKATGGMKTLLTAVVWSGVILGVAELLDMLQVFPDGTVMADMLYEKEIPVLLLFLWAVMQVKNSKK